MRKAIKQENLQAKTFKVQVECNAN